MNEGFAISHYRVALDFLATVLFCFHKEGDIVLPLSWHHRFVSVPHSDPWIPKEAEALLLPLLEKAKIKIDQIGDTVVLKLILLHGS